ncbi:hypothetical protein H6F74_24930 [Trichocoleus sp. FACHB-90]|uniref:hypothetical protein n=1 Tax=Cyanophyceae TaxID=3028117 RepID=UPI001682FA7F|nr:hypothetical protein [Trichocoleus sp. FACHB-90]MBD1929460.1 hypothetical protein [Trichocoleus sp. FACHB-90]
MKFFPDLVATADLLEYKCYLSHSLKPQSINCQLTTIKVFLNWAMSAGMIPSVPKIPKVVKENRRGIRWLNRTITGVLEQGVTNLRAIRSLIRGSTGC